MPVRLLESLHGAFGVLAMVALLHPAILLWRGRPLSRGARWAVGLSMALVGSAFGLGLAIYGPYRNDIRRNLFTFHPRVGLLFETKEHMAYAVIALTLGAGMAALVAPPGASEIRKAASRVFAAAALAALVVAAIGTYVASTRGFPNP